MEYHLLHPPAHYQTISMLRIDRLRKWRNLALHFRILGENFISYNCYKMLFKDINLHFFKNILLKLLYGQQDSILVRWTDMLRSCQKVILSGMVYIKLGVRWFCLRVLNINQSKNKTISLNNFNTNYTLIILSAI